MRWEESGATYTKARDVRKKVKGRKMQVGQVKVTEVESGES